MTKKHRYSIFILACGLAAQSALANAGGGSEVGGGGDLYSFEFKTVARKLLSRMKEVGGHRFNANLNELGKAIDSTFVKTVEEPCKLQLKSKQSCPANMVRDAVNFSIAGRVEIGRSFWASIAQDERKKERIVLHELYGILGVEKDDDRLSLQDLDLIHPERMNQYSQGSYVEGVNIPEGTVMAWDAKGKPVPGSVATLSDESQCLNRCDTVLNEEASQCAVLHYQSERKACESTFDADAGFRAKDCYSRCEGNVNWKPIAKRYEVAPLVVDGKPLRPLTAECESVNKASLTGLTTQTSYQPGTAAFKQIQNYLTRGWCNRGDIDGYIVLENGPSGFYQTTTSWDGLSERLSKIHEGMTLREHVKSKTNTSILVKSKSVVTRAFAEIAKQGSIAIYFKTENFNVDTGKKMQIEEFHRMNFVLSSKGNLDWIEDFTLIRHKGVLLTTNEGINLQIHTRKESEKDTVLFELTKNESSMKDEFKKDVISKLQ